MSACYSECFGTVRQERYVGLVGFECCGSRAWIRAMSFISRRRSRVQNISITGPHDWVGRFPVVRKMLFLGLPDFIAQISGFRTDHEPHKWHTTQKPFYCSSRSLFVPLQKMSSPHIAAMSLSARNVLLRTFAQRITPLLATSILRNARSDCVRT